MRRGRIIDATGKFHAQKSGRKNRKKLKERKKKEISLKFQQTIGFQPKGKPMPKTVDAKAVLLDDNHSGRDEMNLAGNPFALLQPHGRGTQTEIIREWKRELPSGKIVDARWEVSGHASLGLPGPNEELLYLVLLQITREAAGDNEWPRVVHFSRYDLLKRMNWPANGNSYKALRDSFMRLSGVVIAADYAFWDARLKTPYKTISFHILEEFALADEPKRLLNQGELPFSWFKWNETLHASFLAGNVRSLALDFTLSLETPISRRLFRLLELLRHARKPALSEVKLDVFAVRDRLGMTAYAYPSKVKEKLAPAIDELVARNYLDRVDYIKEKKTETAVFIFASVRRSEGEIGQGRAEQGNNTIISKPTVKTPLKPSQMAFLDEDEQSDVRLDAIRCHAVFLSLEKSEQNELLELARRDVSPIWHDRVGQPESPMSLGLWQMVAQRYPQRLK